MGGGRWKLGCREMAAKPNAPGRDADQKSATLATHEGRRELGVK